jgi:hypothetical protein
MTEIKVVREDNKVEAGVFRRDDGDYYWLTYTTSGICKKLATAMRKAGFTE